MKQIIFSKYSNDRCNQYKIRTSIVLEEDGTRSVVKSPISDASKKHISHICQAYHDLNQAFEQSRFAVADCRLEEEQAIMSYVEGETLESRINDLANHGDVEHLVRVIQDYAAEIRTCAKVPFVPSSEYSDIFGIQKLDGKMSLPVSNIDMIFPNIIENNDQWYIIDYEWTFDFMVPVDFIIYRAVYYYILNKGHSDIKINLFDEVGISGEDCDTYSKMEVVFQKFLTDNHHPLHKLYQTIHGHNYVVSNLVNEYRAQHWLGLKEISTYQKFKDETKNHNLVVPVQRLNSEDEETAVYEIIVDLEDGVEEILISPCEKPCELTMKEVVIKNEKDIIRSVPYNVNGVTVDGKIIYYTETPYLISVDGINGEDKQLKVRFEIRALSPKIAEKIKNQASSYIQLNEERTQLQKLYEEQLENNKKLMHELLESKAQYEHITHSKSWKMTEPFRKIFK